MVVVEENRAPGDDPVLVDLLRAMISGTHWCYAEAWVPCKLGNLRRHVLAAAYALPGRGAGMCALERLSRSLMLKPGECLLRHAHEQGISASSRPHAVNHDVACNTEEGGSGGSGSSSTLDVSPRARALNEASIALAMSFRMIDNDGSLVVLMSQRGPSQSAEERAADATHLGHLSALCQSVGPYLTRMNRTADPEDKKQAIPPASYPHTVASELEDSASKISNQQANAETGDSSVVDEKHTRSPITYKSPMRRKFNVVSEDIRVKSVHVSPSGSKFGSHGCSSLAVEYQVAINEALSKFPPLENGKPHALRVSALWNIFEQLCQSAGSLNNVLTHMRKELKRAIFSDDLMAADDGLSLIRTPYFEQIDYRRRQVEECEQKLAQLQKQLEQLHNDQYELRKRVEHDQKLIEQLKRKAFLSERKVVKVRLTTFFQRRSMADDLRKQQSSEFQALELEIQKLKKMLELEEEKRLCRFVEDSRNVEVVEAFGDSLNITAVMPTPAVMNCVISPVGCPDTLSQHPACAKEATNEWSEMIPTLDEEVQEFKKQMLILSNANLTLYEHQSTNAAEHQASEHHNKYSFISTIDVLEHEIRRIDSWLRSENADEQLAAPYARMLEKVQEESNSNHRKAQMHVVTKTQSGSVRSVSRSASSLHVDLSNPSEDPVAGEAEVDFSAIWTEGPAKTGDDLRLLEILGNVSPKERVRELSLQAVRTWIFIVLQRKADAEFRLQVDPSVSYRTVKHTFFDFLEEKYGSKDAAKLAAYDILHFIEQHRSNNAMLQVFAKSIVANSFHGHWRYILRAQQFTSAFYPGGFPNLETIETFFIHRFYSDQTRFEIDKVIAAFKHFSPYVRRLAEGGGTLGAQPDIDSQDGIVGRAEGTATTPLEGRGKSIPLEIFGDFVAHMLQCGEELRVKKVDIVLQVQGIDNTIPMSYETFEKLAVMCVPHSMEVAACQHSYRLLLRYHPDRRFPMQGLSMSIAALELDALLEKYNVPRQLQLAIVD